MKRRTLLFALPALVAVPAGAQTMEDPDEVLWRIRDDNIQGLGQREPDIAAIIKTRADTAKAAVKGVDPAKVVPKKGLSWAQLYFFAEKYEESRTAARRFLTTFPGPKARFTAHEVIIESSFRLGDAKALVATIAVIKPPSPASAAHVAIMTGSEIVRVVAEKLGLQAGEELLTKVEALVPFDQMTYGTDRILADQANLFIAMGRADLLNMTGKHAEALDVLKAARQKFTEGSAAARLMDDKLKQANLLGTAAPPLTRERSYGDFSGLEALRGKVVLLDFTAHWSPFAGRGYPGLRKLYDELKGKGLEVVSVTKYYGFFGNERGVTTDQEFAKMAEHRKRYDITWPMVFGPRSNAEAYGVGVFPHYVVVGRDGKVVYNIAGYSTDLFHRLRVSVEKALAQPSASG